MDGRGFSGDFGRWKEGLEDLSAQMSEIVETTSRNVIERAADRPAMALAYAALSGQINGDVGRQAFRRALIADGIPEDRIVELDALYTRCLLDPTLDLD